MPCSKPDNQDKKPGTKFVISPSGVKAIYSDNDKSLLKRLDHSEKRASHVDPLEPPKWFEWLAIWRLADLIRQQWAYDKFGAGHWAIYWKNDYSSWSSDFYDDVGQPFTTKKEAEMYEVARLERDSLKIRPDTALHLEALKREKR